jgi:hypothetical protein
MDGEVDGVVEEGALDFFDEEAIAADLGERSVAVLVAFCADFDDFDMEAGVCGFEGIGDPIGLPHGELAAAGADADGLGHGAIWMGLC